MKHVNRIKHMSPVRTFKLSSRAPYFSHTLRISHDHHIATNNTCIATNARRLIIDDERKTKIRHFIFRQLSVEIRGGRHRRGHARRARTHGTRLELSVRDHGVVWVGLSHQSIETSYDAGRSVFRVRTNIERKGVYAE